MGLRVLADTSTIHKESSMCIYIGDTFVTCLVTDTSSTYRLSKLGSGQVSAFHTEGSIFSAHLPVVLQVDSLSAYDAYVE